MGQDQQKQQERETLRHMAYLRLENSSGKTECASGMRVIE